MAGQHLEMQRADLVEFRLADALARQLAGHRLQPAHHLEQVVDGLAREQHHLGAAVGQQRDQPVAGQHLEGLAQWRARDLELVAQHALVEPGARGEVALDNHRPQTLGHRHMQYLAVDGEGFGRRDHVHGLTILYSKSTLGQARTKTKPARPHRSTIAAPLQAPDNALYVLISLGLLLDCSCSAIPTLSRITKPQCVIVFWIQNSNKD